MSNPGNVLDPVAISLAGVHSIEASAGTGKTYTITTLYLRYLLELQMPVDRILVTTFTDAATAELRGRLRERIAAARELIEAFDDEVTATAAADSGDIDGQLFLILKRAGAWQSNSRERQIDRLEAALLSFDQAPVFTIHGFCNRVLQELVFETGTQFNLELVSSVDDLIEESVHDFIARHWCGPDPQLTRWLRLDETLHASLSRAAREAAENPSFRIVPDSTADDSDDSYRPDHTQRRSGVSRTNDIESRVPDRRCAPSGLLSLLEQPVVTQVESLLEELAELWPQAQAEIRASLFAAREAGMLHSRNLGGANQIEAGLEFVDALGRTKAIALFRIGSKTNRKTGETELDIPPAQRRLATSSLESNTKKAFAGQTPQHRIFDLSDELLAMLPQVQAIQRQLQRTLLVSVARETREHVEQRKRELGIMSFGDLLHQVDSALAGPQGELLLEQLRERYHVALVDEFQDTDPVQFRIFSRVFHEAATTICDAGESSRAFVMIGDPKQSIYRFRGADLQAYLQATRQTPASNRHSMGTNWRTDQSLVQAVQRVFETASDPFMDHDIVVPPIAAQFDDRLTEPSALIVTLVPRPDDCADESVPKNDVALNGVASRVAADIAADLARELVIPDRHGGQRPVRPSDIAVLARTGKHLRAIQAALRELGIPSVLQTDDSVYASNEAAALCHVLKAVLSPGSPTLMANALQTAVFGLTASQLVALTHDADQLAEWSERFREWNQTWHRDGIMVMWRRLLDNQNTIVRLTGQVSGERQITNLLHLGELLHRHATENHTGPDALLRWFELQVSDPRPRDDEAQLRLETDADAVQLCTIHKSKGLEWPIVYCPTLWAYRDPNWRRPSVLLSRMGANDSTLDIPEIDVGSELLDDRIALNISQEHAEERRLLYVALSRARHQCHLHWTAARDAFQTALGQIVTDGQKTSGKESDDEIETMLQRWLRRLNVDRTELRGIDFESPEAVPFDASSDRRPGVAADHWKCRPVTRRPIEAATQTSFTAMARSFDTGADVAFADRDANAPGWRVAESALPTSITELPLARMPGGVGIGTLVHDVFEAMLTSDWDNVRQDEALTEHVGQQLRERMPRVQLDERWHEPLTDAVTRCLTLPLTDSDAPLRLIETARSRLVCELPFVLSCGNWHSPGGFGSSFNSTGFTSEALAAALESSSSGDDRLDSLLREYASRIQLMTAPPVRGFLAGFIDLVVEHDGRWFLLDYKTNQLGPTAADYSTAALQDAMIEHDYLLQMLLYCVALQRHLQRRKPDFDWDRDFGGVVYLFVRGLAENAPPGSGLFFARPQAALIQRLSNILSREDN
ncbi:MAG: UvrD-helicase domain-containing protein [Planctomycetota bacterium]|jgi:exodeoxyribonuclease V beta subunit